MTQRIKGSALVDDVVGYVVDRRVRARTRSTGAVDETLRDALYHYQQTSDQQIDSPSLRAFAPAVQRVQRELWRASSGEQQVLLAELVRSYANHIGEDYDGKVPELMRDAVPRGVMRLLDAIGPWVRFEPPEMGYWDDVIAVRGAVNEFKSLMQAGSVIFAVSHASNGDALVFSSALRSMGIHGVAHGALQSYAQHPLVRRVFTRNPLYQMDAAYTDPLYRETLAEFTTVLSERGVHQFLFPTAHRSRSGRVVKSLDPQSLVSVFNSFYRGAELGGRRKVFVVPVTISYPWVLEAQTLAEEWYRRASGDSVRIAGDEFESIPRWLSNTRHIFSRKMPMYVHFGQALDALGNPVNAQGESMGAPGMVVDPHDYLRVRGRLVEDDARDHVYLSFLAQAVERAWQRDTVVHSTHVVAYVVFDMLWRASEEKNVRRFLHRLVLERPVVDEANIRHAVTAALEQLASLALAGRVQLSTTVAAFDETPIVSEGLQVLMECHEKPVFSRIRRRLRVDNPKLLFYYRNMLDPYRIFGRDSLVDSGRLG